MLVGMATDFPMEGRSNAVRIPDGLVGLSGNVGILIDGPLASAPAFLAVGIPTLTGTVEFHVEQAVFLVVGKAVYLARFHGFKNHRPSSVQTGYA
jgi:hypothetical protein